MYILRNTKLNEYLKRTSADTCLAPKGATRVCRGYIGLIQSHSCVMVQSIFLKDARNRRMAMHETWASVSTLYLDLPGRVVELARVRTTRAHYGKPHVRALVAATANRTLSKPACMHTLRHA